MLNLTAFAVNLTQMTTISFVAFLLFCRTYSVTALLWAVFTLLCGLMGLVIFAFNKYCDPIKDGEIISKDQVVTLKIPARAYTAKYEG